MKTFIRLFCFLLSAFPIFGANVTFSFTDAIGGNRQASLTITPTGARVSPDGLVTIERVVINGITNGTYTVTNMYGGSNYFYDIKISGRRDSEYTILVPDTSTTIPVQGLVVTRPGPGGVYYYSAEAANRRFPSIPGAGVDFITNADGTLTVYATNAADVTSRLLNSSNLLDVVSPGAARTNIAANNASNLTAGSIPLARLGAITASAVLTNTFFRTNITILDNEDNEVRLVNDGSGLNIFEGGVNTTIASGVVSSLEFDANQDSVYGFRGPSIILTNSGVVTTINSNRIVTGQITTTGLTNSGATASTVAIYDANKRLLSLANGLGALTNDGSGNLGFSASVSGSGTVSNISTLTLNSPLIGQGNGGLAPTNASAFLGLIGAQASLGFTPSTNSHPGITNSLGFSPMTNSPHAVTNALGFGPATNSFPGITNALGYAPASNASVSVTYSIVTNALGYRPPTNRFEAVDYWTPDGTDHSAGMSNLLSAVYAAGGGTIHFAASPTAYRADSMMFIPNSGGSPQATNVNIRMYGDGGGQNWYHLNSPGASILDLRYTGTAGAKLESLGLGALVIENLTIKDGGSSNNTALIHVSNTTLAVDNCSIIGSFSSFQDGIVFGGTNAALGNTTYSGFQGYGSRVTHNHFSRLGRGVYGRTWANSIVVTDNSFQGNTYARCAIEFDDTSDIGTSGNAGNDISRNLIEMDKYTNGIVLIYAHENVLSGNSFWDGGTQARSCYALTNSFRNTIIVGVEGGIRTLSGDSGSLIASDPYTTIIGNSHVRTNSYAAGLQGSEISGGLVIKGDVTDRTMSGQLVVATQGDPRKFLNIALDGNNAFGSISATNSDAQVSLPLKINPGGDGTFGGVYFGGTLYASNGVALPSTTASLVGDDQTVSVIGKSVVIISSDNASASSRTFKLSQGINGKKIILIWSGANAGELIDNSVNLSAGNVRLNGNWTPIQYDALMLIGVGDDWVELARSSPSGSGAGDAFIADGLDQFAATTSAEFFGVISDENGSGQIAGTVSPSFTTPSLGVATATSINGTVIPASRTLIATTNTITALTATNSAAYRGKVTDPTGTGSWVFSDNAVLVAPTLGAATATTLNTGLGANELYPMDQDVLTTSAVIFGTIDTGQGANELYDMDQNVLTTSSPTFAGITAGTTVLRGGQIRAYTNSASLAGNYFGSTFSTNQNFNITLGTTFNTNQVYEFWLTNTSSGSITGTVFVSMWSMSATNYATSLTFRGGGRYGVQFKTDTATNFSFNYFAYPDNAALVSTVAAIESSAGGQVLMTTGSGGVTNGAAGTGTMTTAKTNGGTIATSLTAIDIVSGSNTTVTAALSGTTAIYTVSAAPVLPFSTNAFVGHTNLMYMTNVSQYFVATTNCAVTNVFDTGSADTRIANLMISNSASANITLYVEIPAGRAMGAATTNALVIPSGKVGELTVKTFARYLTNYVTTVQQ